MTSKLNNSNCCGISSYEGSRSAPICPPRNGFLEQLQAPVLDKRGVPLRRRSTTEKKHCKLGLCLLSGTLPTIKTFRIRSNQSTGKRLSVLKNTIIALLVAAAPASATAATFANGDFESALAGWTTSGRFEALPGSAYADGIGTAATLAQRLNTYVFIGAGEHTGTNTLSQSFTTSIGQTYNFSFEVLAVGGSTQAISYQFGSTIGSVTPSSGNNFSNFSTVTGSFTASGLTSTVTFMNTTAPDGTDLALDNVVVSSVGGVPEPASWALLIAGFGFTGAAMRRRRSAVAV